MPTPDPLELQLPPQNLVAEQGVLGGVLRDNSTLNEVVTILRAVDFYRDSHRILWTAIAELHADGRPIDALILAEYLQQSGMFDRVGGDAYLFEILDSVPHAANTRYYAEIVREKAIMRELVEAQNDTLREAYSGLATADDTLDHALRRVFAISERQAGRGDVQAATAALEAMALIEARQEGNGGGFSFGLQALDDVTGGMRPGHVYIIAARPSMGKTALALHICDYLTVTLGLPCLFVSMEMNYAELFVRLLGSRAGISSDYTQGLARMGPDERERLEEAYTALRQAPLVIDDTPVHTPSQIYANARRHRHARDLSALFVDYLQLIDVEQSKGESRQEQVAKISRRIKTLAMALGVPVVLLSQLNRAAEAREDHRPRMADLRETGAIEQDADVVMLLYRPEYYDPNDQPGLCECIVAKNRNGKTGTVRLGFDKETNRFGEYVEPAVRAMAAGNGQGVF